MLYKLKRSAGFSLIEVMVALLIVAISLGGVTYTVGNVARNETVIGEKTFARWVAMNQIAKAQIERTWPSIGTSNGDETLAGIVWKWEQKALNTADENVRKIEVSVWSTVSDQENPSVTLTGFLAK
ncbi:MAG: Type II secretion system protein GspI [uncultured Thiotrichaceae bacterium]|uniref:Type II secretion system protein I n=1 Tax=uncultured Thiotrichaceae bacterium TaxID=298394 RepID=A0A6S6SY14_9GAMM|nr:MAG: Type II secretion system protein GspI [uncultured Thiotrichaceae bacterium]